jgi:hypothetical protein
MDTDLIFQIIITSVLVPLLGWGVKLLTSYMNEKIATMEDQRLAKALSNATDELERAANLAVTQVQETFVSALKKEGKFTSKEAEIAASKALSETRKIMSDSGMKIITDAAVDVESYIKSLIEENVGINKPEVVEVK